MSSASPVPLPVRVLVKGASTVNWMSWMGGPRSDFSFPRAIQEQLAREGRASDVRAITMPSEQTKRILKTWQEEVLGFSPDVIVLVYGHYETIHFFLPRWLERHANSLRGKPRWWTDFYRKRVLRPVWATLAKFQAVVDKALPATLRKNRPVRVAADLQRYITQVQKIGSPMVVLFELLPPATKFLSWFPGMSERIGVMNDTIAAMVADLDLPHVRYFRVSELVEKLYDGDIDAATPDGFHYTPELHRAIGQALAGEIEDWVRAEGHIEGSPAATDAAQ